VGRMGRASGLDRFSAYMGRETLSCERRLELGAIPNVKSNCFDLEITAASTTAKTEAQTIRTGAMCAPGARTMLTLSALLFQNGLPDLPVSLIEPHRNQARAWRVKFSYESCEPLSMSVAQASTMIPLLHQLGEIELADEIDGAVQSAARYACM
jgi:hypothetical protein